MKTRQLSGNHLVWCPRPRLHLSFQRDFYQVTTPGRIKCQVGTVPDWVLLTLSSDELDHIPRSTTRL